MEDSQDCMWIDPEKDGIHFLSNRLHPDGMACNGSLEELRRQALLRSGKDIR